MKMSTKSQGKNSKKQQARPVFDSIRKRIAPPGHPITHLKPEEKARPSQRKAKHKRRPDELEEVEELEGEM
jgi:hypothetical protein